jgi:hypothetical protein
VAVLRRCLRREVEEGGRRRWRSGDENEARGLREFVMINVATAAAGVEPVVTATVPGTCGAAGTGAGRRNARLMRC